MMDETTRLKTQVKTGIPMVGVRLRAVDEKGIDVPRDEITMGEIVFRRNIVMNEY
jgi:fatty-acyl-CoA synthase